MAAYQLLVMLVLIYFGTLIFFEESFNLVSEPLRDPITRDGTDRLRMNTIMFYTFILMNLFNQINSRNLDEHNINVFDKIWTNVVFIIVLAAEFFISVEMVRAGKSKLFSKIVGTSEIT